MERRTKGLFTMFLGLSLLLTACGGEENPASSAEQKVEGKTYTFQLGNAQKEEHPYNVVLTEMAQNVEEKTDGKVKFEIHGMSALGAERELVEALQVGTVDAAMVSTGPIANFYPQMGVVDLPFLFSSREQVYKVLDGEIGQDLLNGLEDTGIVGLAWAENGFRHMTNSKKPITSPSDLAGLKIRTMENPIHLEAFKAMGANPTPMAWTEALTSMQQGVVDGQENPLVIADTFKLYDMGQKHMTLTGHLYSPALILFSKSVWDTLPAEYQVIIREEAKLAGDKERQLIVEADTKAMGVLKENGVEIIEEVDVQPFRDAIKPVYEKYEAQFGKDLIDGILNTK
jgi:tripartite ATP-independent transporter DctP family solute receptor